MTEHIQPTDERAFEKSIELALIGSTSESRKADGQTDVDVQRPSADEYYWGKPSDMDKKMALDLRRLWHFLKTIGRIQGWNRLESCGGAPHFKNDRIAWRHRCIAPRGGRG